MVRLMRHARLNNLPTPTLGLSQRADHDDSQFCLLHGSLFDVRCSSFFCNHLEHNNFTDPIVPALAIPTAVSHLARTGLVKGRVGSTVSPDQDIKPDFPKPNISEELDISDDRVELPEIDVADLPRCPRCNTGMLRPGVVWFGEPLPKKVLEKIDQFIGQPEKIDLILVIGTSAQVYVTVSRLVHAVHGSLG